jgi:hypothetical protein
MNPRERTIAYAVFAAVVLAAGAFLFHQLYLGPLHDRQESVAAARKALDDQEQRIQKMEEKQAQLKEWRKESLPKDIGLCRRRYDEFLRDLMTKNGFKDYQVKENETSDLVRTVAQADKKALPYTPLTFTVTGRADLSQVVKLLEQFYHAPLLHKVKDLKIKRVNVQGSGPRTSRDVDMELKLEAIIVSDAEDRPDLLPGPNVAVNNLAVPPREYAAIAVKNVLYGPPPPPSKLDEGPDPANSITLTSITHSEAGWEAVMHNDEDKRSWRLRPQEGYVVFQVRYKKRGVLRLMGEVVRIDLGDLVFCAAGKHYRFVLGKTLADALRTPLTDAQVKALEQTQGTGERPEATPSSFVEGRPREFPGLRRVSTPGPK